MRKRVWWLLLLIPFLGCNGQGVSSGDRVLVAKCLYETNLMPPRRFDVVVFKYPVQPTKGTVPTNYIKRLLGLPGELIAIFFGQIFRMTPTEPVPGLPPNENDLTLWQSAKQPTNNLAFCDQLNAWFAEEKLEIVRKPPQVMMAMRRIVNDNDYQASDLPRTWARWQFGKDGPWNASEDRKTFTFRPAVMDGATTEPAWLTYRHYVRDIRGGPVPGNAVPKAQLITDAMGYNNFNLHDDDTLKALQVNWVGDLMLEATVEPAASSGRFVMELNRGVDRFRADWNLETGECELFRFSEDAAKPVSLGKAATTLKGTGAKVVRFANFDSRLTVWVDRDLPFGDGVDYAPVEFPAGDKNDRKFSDLRDRFGPRKGDIDHPARFGGIDAEVVVRGVRLWRDTYYTMNANGADLTGANVLTQAVLANPEEWGRFRNLNPTGYYVYPGHYMCLGDNSTHSSDSRQWGMVPRRLMLGRALTIYFPVERFGLIH